MQEIKVYRLTDEYIKYFQQMCSCGKPEQIGDMPPEMVKVSEILNAGSKDVFIAEVMGDSMVEVDIRKGDKVVINSQLTAQDGDVVLAYLDDEYLLKFLKIDGNGDKWLVAANPQYKPIRIDSKFASTAIVGVMASIVRPRPRMDKVLLKRFSMDIEEEMKVVKTSEKENRAFYKLISNERDKKVILERLHNLLDGKSGIAVIKVLRAALELSYLIELPSYGVLKKEFSVEIQSSFYYRERDKMFGDSELDSVKDSLM